MKKKLTKKRVLTMLQKMKSIAYELYLDRLAHGSTNSNVMMHNKTLLEIINKSHTSINSVRKNR